MDGAEGVVAEPEVAAPEAGAETQSQDEFHGFDDAQKKRVSEIIQARVKGFSRFGKPEEIESRLKRAEETERWAEQVRQRVGAAPGQPLKDGAKAELSDEDKKVLAYMEKLNPGFSKWQEERQGIYQQLGYLQEARWQSVTETNTNALKSWVKESGYDDKHFTMVNKMVADSIRGNQADHQAYLRSGSSQIVKKHFDAVNEFIKGFGGAPVTPAAKTAQAAAAGARIAKLAPKMPAGGVTAPTSKTEKMSDKERVDAAFAAFTGKGAAA